MILILYASSVIIFFEVVGIGSTEPEIVDYNNSTRKRNGLNSLGKGHEGESSTSKLTDESVNENPNIFKRNCEIEIFTCIYCKEKIRNATTYEIHGRIKHPGEKLFYCTSCTEGFTNKRSYDRHVKAQHKKVDVFSCQHCKKCHNRKDSHKRHEISCIVGKYVRGVKGRHFEREEVGKKFKGDWEVSKSYCKIFICIHCGERITGVKNYEMHGKMKHAGEKLFHCTSCTEGFTQRGSLARHVKTLHKKGNLTCQYCNKLYARKDSHWEHEISCSMGKFDGRVEEKHFESDEVGKKFSEDWEIPTSFCEIFICVHCGEILTGVKNYEIHGKTKHAGEKLFHCTSCMEGFARRCSLNRHVKRVHKTDDFPQARRQYFKTNLVISGLKQLEEEAPEMEGKQKNINLLVQQQARKIQNIAAAQTENIELPIHKSDVPEMDDEQIQRNIEALVQQAREIQNIAAAHTENIELPIHKSDVPEMDDEQIQRNIEALVQQAREIQNIAAAHTEKLESPIPKGDVPEMDDEQIQRNMNANRFNGI